MGLFTKKNTENRFDELFFNRLNESWEDISAEDFLGYLRVKGETAITWDEVAGKLKENRKLRIKLGIDPTGADIHLGHVVPIMLLRQFLKAGHHIDFIIGDFTGQVGDPSGRESARVTLTPEVIENNLATYKNQISRYIDTEKITIRRNSEWLSKMTLPELFPLLESINLSEAMQRDDFRTRTKTGHGVSLAEATYGVLMGIDSVNLNTDIEIGGLDQLLNFQQCRSVMRVLKMTEEAVITTPILEGTAGDGKKMSKSFNNYIAVSSSLEDKFGKIMSIPDSLIFSYFRSFADVHEKDMDSLSGFIDKNPLEAKKQLGVFIVALETGNLEEGIKERDNFERKFSKKEFVKSDTISIKVSLGTTIFDALVESNQFTSKTEIRRLFEQEAVRLLNGDDEKILTLEDKVDVVSGIIRAGKLKFFNISTD